jgi:hypothetical protein
MTPEQTHLADKIIKLLALASSTTFAEEAATAKAMADELMRKHNIELAPASGKPSQDTIEIRHWEPFARGAKWEGIIANALCDFCSCVLLYTDALDEFTLVRTIFNLDILEYMLREISIQRASAWMKYKGRHGEDNFWKFCYGFAQALKHKIAAITPVNSERPRLLAWYEANVLMGGKLGCGKDLSVGRASSEAGLAAGRDASLHRGTMAQPYKQIAYKPK